MQSFTLTGIRKEQSLRRFLGSRRGLFILLGFLAVGGIALNWGWLAAVGVAPILLSLAPCAVMCALGLCMGRSAGSSCAKDTASKATTVETAVEPAAPLRLAAPSDQPTDRTAIQERQIAVMGSAGDDK